MSDETNASEESASQQGAEEQTREEVPPSAREDPSVPEPISTVDVRNVHHAHGTPESREKACAEMQVKIATRLEQVMDLVQERKVIANDDVEKTLGVSDNTAMRYLSRLVKLGKLRRIGAAKTGRWVKYEEAV